jgi:hypothetical protein
MTFKSKTIILGLYMSAVLGIALAANGGSAKAYTLSPAVSTSAAPAYIINSIEEHCDPGGAYGWTMFQTLWISPVGKPTQTTVTVTAGTSKVDLQLNWITYRCKTSTDPIIGGKVKVLRTTPTIDALVGYVHTYSYWTVASAGYKSGVSKTFTYDKGRAFTNGETISISMDKKGTVRRGSSVRYTDYCAVVKHESAEKIRDLDDFDASYTADPAYCIVGNEIFNIRATVISVPPAGLSGEKVMNVTTGDTDVPAIRTLRTQVEGSGSSTSQPFYFNASPGDGDPIEVTDPANGTSHEVAIDIGSLSGYRLVGYGICQNGVADCDNPSIRIGGKYYRTLPAGAASFNYTFEAGENYKMRWVFAPVGVVTCGEMTVDPIDLDEDDQFSITATILDGSALPAARNMEIYVDGKGAARPSSTRSGTTGWTATRGPIAAFGADRSVKVEYQQVIGGSLQGPRCEGTIYVHRKPYFRVLGGDILSNGSLQTWTTGAPTFRGGGSQLAALVKGQAVNFPTGAGEDISRLPFPTGRPEGSRLAFSNLDASVSIPDQIYGGDMDVVPEYTSTFVGTGDTVNITNDRAFPDQGGYAYYDATPSGGTLTLNGGTLSAGKVLTLEVDGTLYIKKNITYDYIAMDQIPRLNVYANKIIVGENVGEIHGVFVSRGSGTSGEFISCGLDAGSIGVNYAKLAADANARSRCNKQLKVYGAVVASNFIMTRTFNSYASGGNHEPAEEFIYSPETWLMKPSKVVTTPTYDSYESLPPVL